MADLFIKNTNSYRKKISKGVLKASRKEAEAYLLDKAVDMALDFFGNCEIPGVVDVHPIEILGSENGIQSLLKNGGRAAVKSVIRLDSGRKVVAYLSFPVYKANMYLPSMIKLDGKRYVLSCATVSNYVSNFKTTTPEVSGLFSNSPEMSHFKEYKKDMFAIEDYENVHPTRIL